MHIGFTGTRFGMTEPQRRSVADRIDLLADIRCAHHGLCVGADAEFHEICRARAIPVAGHPGPDWPSGELCARIDSCSSMFERAGHMKRNSAIVAAVQIMIAAPYENEPQARGGTWATIGMARRALRRGTLKELYVVGRDGSLLDHTRWP